MLHFQKYMMILLLQRGKIDNSGKKVFEYISLSD